MKVWIMWNKVKIVLFFLVIVDDIHLGKFDKNHHGAEGYTYSYRNGQTRKKT